MAVMNLLKKRHNERSKGYFVLIDPDKKNVDTASIIESCQKNRVDGIMIGGSCERISKLNETIRLVRKLTDRRIILFPGSKYQVNRSADAIFLLNLINSKDIRFVIGEHVESSENLYKSGLEIINTAYILIASEKHLSVVKRAKTDVISSRKVSYIKKYIYAAALMPFDMIYLEAGSGASKPIESSIVEFTSETADKPLFVGGGISTPESGEKLLRSGADFIVTGNAVEKDPMIIKEFVKMTKRLNGSL